MKNRLRHPGLMWMALILILVSASALIDIRAGSRVTDRSPAVAQVLVRPAPVATELSVILAPTPTIANLVPQIAGARAIGADGYNAFWQGRPRSNFTCRSIQRITAGGPAIRVRLSNVKGDDPLTFDQVYVGISTSGPATTSNIQVLFNGSPTVTIPVGQQVYSDKVALSVMAEDDVAVSFYMAGPAPTRWSAGWPEEISYSSYCTAWMNGGNHAADTDSAAFQNWVVGPQGAGPLLFLTAVDVFTSQPTGSIIVIGDSITAGSATLGSSGNNRWSDVLARRLQQSSNPKPVANLAIAGGACEIAVGGAEPLLSRIKRDILSQSNVSHVIVVIGTNDLAHGVTAARLESCLLKIRDQLHVNGIKMVVGTVIPLSGTRNQARLDVNGWIRANATTLFDGLVDFDLVIRDPSNPDNIRPAYAGDAIHPNAKGQAALGNAVHLALPGSAPMSR